jgi:hypothetical protein
MVKAVALAAKDVNASRHQPLDRAVGSTLHQSDSRQVTAIVVPSGSGKVGTATAEQTWQAEFLPEFRT